VVVKGSLIPGAGLGLFATLRVREGTAICPSVGPIVTLERFLESPSAYGLQVKGW
jgi:hypothetical protein